MPTHEIAWEQSVLVRLTDVKVRNSLASVRRGLAKREIGFTCFSRSSERRLPAFASRTYHKETKETKRLRDTWKFRWKCRLSLVNFLFFVSILAPYYRQEQRYYFSRLPRTTIVEDFRNLFVNIYWPCKAIETAQGMTLRNNISIVIMSSTRKLVYVRYSNNVQNFN